MENASEVPYTGCLAQEPSLQGLTVGELIQDFLDRCEEKGLYVLFDRHTTNGKIQEYPWAEGWSLDRSIQAWVTFLNRFGTHPTLMGVDLLNEPHGSCELNNCAMYYYAEAMKQIEAETDFDGLYFLEGVQFSKKDGLYNGWGGSVSDLDTLSTIKKRGTNNLFDITHPNPVCLTGIDRNRFVLSVHQYGPDVRGVSEDDYYENWMFVWETPELDHWYDTPIVVGEWGGFMRTGSTDLAYWNDFVKAMHDKGFAPVGTFFWCLNPDSADTGGILSNDYETVNTVKLDVINRSYSFV